MSKKSPYENYNKSKEEFEGEYNDAPDIAYSSTPEIVQNLEYRHSLESETSTGNPLITFQENSGIVFINNTAETEIIQDNHNQELNFPKITDEKTKKNVTKSMTMNDDADDVGIIVTSKKNCDAEDKMISITAKANTEAEPGIKPVKSVSIEHYPFQSNHNIPTNAKSMQHNLAKEPVDVPINSLSIHHNLTKEASINPLMPAEALDSNVVKPQDIAIPSIHNSTSNSGYKNNQIAGRPPINPDGEMPDSHWLVIDALKRMNGTFASAETIIDRSKSMYGNEVDRFKGAMRRYLPSGTKEGQLVKINIRNEDLYQVADQNGTLKKKKKKTVTNKAKKDELRTKKDEDEEDQDKGALYIKIESLYKKRG